MSDTNNTEIREISASELSDGISAEMPHVTQHGEENNTTTEPVKIQPSENPPIYKPTPPYADVNGLVFNAAIHRTDENGKPDLRRGAFVRIKTGRPSKEEMRIMGNNQKPNPEKRAEYVKPSSDSSEKSKVVLPSVAPQTEPQTFNENPTNERAKKKADKEAAQLSGHEVTAETYLQVGYAIAEGFFGQEVRPDDDSEHQMLKGPLVALLTEKGEIPLSPTVLFCLTLAAYASKKAAKQSVREKATILFIRFRNWFKSMKS